MKEEDRYSKRDILWRLKRLLAESKIRLYGAIKTKELQETINEIQSLRAENAELRRYVKDNRLI